MKTFLIFAFLCITNFLFPCNWMFDLVDEKYIEAQRELLQFDEHQYYNNPGHYQLTNPETYWYTRGRTEVLLEILDEMSAKIRSS